MLAAIAHAGSGRAEYLIRLGFAGQRQEHVRDGLGFGQISDSGLFGAPVTMPKTTAPGSVGGALGHCSTGFFLSEAVMATLLLMLPARSALAAENGAGGYDFPWHVTTFTWPPAERFFSKIPDR